MFHLEGSTSGREVSYGLMYAVNETHFAIARPQSARQERDF